MTKLLFGLLILLGDLGVSRAATSATLDAKLDEFEIKDEDDFVALCKKLNKGCGMEVPPDGAASKRESRRLKRVSPREILDQYISKNPNYKWTEQNGTMNLQPRERKGDDVLSRKLQAVSIHGASGFKACLDVLNQAEISTGYEIMGRPPRFSPIELELKNVTVRDALNAIAAADGQFIWMFRWSNEKRQGMLNIISWRRSGIGFTLEERKGVHDAKAKRNER